jgi:hypothetical protein
LYGTSPGVVRWGKIFLSAQVQTPGEGAAPVERSSIAGLGWGDAFTAVDALAGRSAFTHPDCREPGHRFTFIGLVLKPRYRAASKDVEIPCSHQVARPN